MALTDRQQGYLMLAVFVLPVFMTWMANGSPMDRASISLVGSGVLAGVLAYIKEALGTSAPASTPAPSQ